MHACMHALGCTDGMSTSIQYMAVPWRVVIGILIVQPLQQAPVRFARMGSCAQCWLGPRLAAIALLAPPVQL